MSGDFGSDGRRNISETGGELAGVVDGHLIGVLGRALGHVADVDVSDGIAIFEVEGRTRTAPYHLWNLDYRLKGRRAVVGHDEI